MSDGIIWITNSVAINLTELEFVFITSPGPGGQNVNKVATAVQLRFDINRAASLPDAVKTRLFLLARNRITTQGELIIRASRFRTQERNKQDAIDRLCELIRRAATPPKPRKKTKPTLASKIRRKAEKKLQSKKKILRQKKMDE